MILNMYVVQIYFSMVGNWSIKQKLLQALTIENPARCQAFQQNINLNDTVIIRNTSLDILPALNRLHLKIQC